MHALIRLCPLVYIFAANQVLGINLVFGTEFPQSSRLRQYNTHQMRKPHQEN